MRESLNESMCETLVRYTYLGIGVEEEGPVACGTYLHPVAGLDLHLQQTSPVRLGPGP
jgi:hypothetical protein